MVALLHFVVALSELLFAGLESPLDLLELIVALRYLLLEVTLELEEFLLDFEEFLLLKHLCFTLCFGEDGTRLLPEELLGHKPRKGCAEDQRTQANDDDCNGSHSLSVIKSSDEGRDAVAVLGSALSIDQAACLGDQRIQGVVDGLEARSQMLGALLERLHALAVAGRYVDGSHRQVAFDGHLRAIGILLPIEAHRMGELFTGLAVEVLFTARHTQGYSCVVDDHRDALECLGIRVYSHNIYRCKPPSTGSGQPTL